MSVSMSTSQNIARPATLAQPNSPQPPETMQPTVYTMDNIFVTPATTWNSVGRKMVVDTTYRTEIAKAARACGDAINRDPA